MVPASVSLLINRSPNINTGLITEFYVAFDKAAIFPVGRIFDDEKNAPYQVIATSPTLPNILSGSGYSLSEDYKFLNPTNDPAWVFATL